MKTLYLDIFSGISGDMFIGAMIDLGVDAHELEHELEKLKVGGYHLHVARGHKASIEGVKFDVHCEHDHEHEHHEHSHAHEHTHAGGPTHSHPHDHGHENGHSHEHEHEHHHEHDEHDESRTFAEIKKLIEVSAFSK